MNSHNSCGDRIKHAVAAVVERGLQDFPDKDFVPNPECLTDRQLALLGALGALLHLWPDQETARTIELRVPVAVKDTKGPLQYCYKPNPNPPPKIIIVPC